MAFSEVLETHPPDNPSDDRIGQPAFPADRQTLIEKADGGDTTAISCC